MEKQRQSKNVISKKKTIFYNLLDFDPAFRQVMTRMNHLKNSSSSLRHSCIVRHRLMAVGSIYTRGNELFLFLHYGKTNR